MIYAIEAVGLDAVKIGFTGSDAGLARRLESLTTGCPSPIRLLGVWREGSQANEKEIHSILDDLRKHGEWFILSSVWPLVFDIFEQWASPSACENCKGPLSLTSLGQGLVLCKHCSNRKAVKEKWPHKRCLVCGEELQSRTRLYCAKHSEKAKGKGHRSGGRGAYFGPSRGAELLRDTGLSLRKGSKALGVSQAAFSKWRAGSVTPGPRHQADIERLMAIPARLWYQPPFERAECTQ